VAVSTELVPKQPLPQRVVAFYHDVVAEMKKVTWPDAQQVRQLSTGVIILSIFIALVIYAMDFIFQKVLVQWLPKLFS
jgi:preprotein translocase subunit SecE